MPSHHRALPCLFAEWFCVFNIFSFGIKAIAICNVGISVSVWVSSTSFCCRPTKKLDKYCGRKLRHWKFICTWISSNHSHLIFPQCVIKVTQPYSCLYNFPKGALSAKTALTKSVVPHLPVVKRYQRMYIRYRYSDPYHCLWRWASFLLPFIFLSLTSPYRPPPPSLCNVSAVPCRQGSLTECLCCYGFIGLVCGRNLWIKVISHCSTFSQAVKLPFTFVPLRGQDRERHM